MRRVVITGIGALTPIGNNIPAYKEGLFNSVSGADYITHFDAKEFRTQFACELKDFNIEEFYHRREARRMDPFSQYAMVVVDEAMAMSGLDIEKIDLSRSGVIWGSGIGGFETLENEIESAAISGKPKYNPFLIPKLIIDIASGHISMKYNFSGPNYSVVSACATSNNSIASSFDTIRLGRADVIITGGSEAAITKTIFRACTSTWG